MTWPWQKRRLNRAHLAQERLELMGRIGRLELSLSRCELGSLIVESRLRREQDHRNGSAFRKAGGTVR